MRKLVLLVAVSGLVLALGTPAEAARKFRVTASISSSTIMIGQPVTISGHVTPKASGQKVALYKKLAGGKWERELVTRVKSDGSFRFTDKPKTRKSRTYRVTKPKSGKYRAGTSKSMRLKIRKVTKSRPTITVSKVSARTIDAGQPVTVSGNASRSVVGRSIQLQVGGGGTWGQITSARIKSNGTFSLTANISQSGASVPLRVLIPNSRYIHATTASAGSVKVFGWHYLYDLGTVEGGWVRDSYAISGTTYPKSVGQSARTGNSTVAQVNLARACKRFVATLGMSDDAESSTVYSTSVLADSVGKYSRTNIALGQAHPVDVDVTGALRLKLDSQHTASGDGRLVWGDARVLCAF